jgi:1-deoxy-D-xylulose 5-phosphate reductoisomerase
MKILNFIADFFRENGNASMTRLGFIIMIVVAMAIAVYQVLVLPDHAFVLSDISGLVALACGLKLWQKGQEVSLEKKENET